MFIKTPIINLEINNFFNMENTMVNDDEEKIRLGLRALTYGLPLKLKEYTYKLFKPGEEIKLPSQTVITDDYQLTIEVEKESNGKKEKAYLGVPVSFDMMISLLTKLTEEDLVYIAGSIAINETYNGKKR